MFWPKYSKNQNSSKNVHVILNVIFIGLFDKYIPTKSKSYKLLEQFQLDC